MLSPTTLHSRRRPVGKFLRTYRRGQPRCLGVHRVHGDTFTLSASHQQTDRDLDRFVSTSISVVSEWSVWLSDRREILEYHLQLARCQSTAGLDRGALPGGSTEGTRYISTCTTMKPPVTATYPRDSHGLRPGNHGQRSCGTVRTSIQARPHSARTYEHWQQIGEGMLYAWSGLVFLFVSFGSGFLVRYHLSSF